MPAPAWWWRYIARLAQSVGDEAWVWLKHALVENIDNRGIDTSRSLRCESLRNKQRRRQVDGDSALEARVRQSFDVVWFKLAGIVDQKRQLAECRRCGNKPTHRLMVGEVGEYNAGASACPGNRGRKPLGIVARIICMQCDRIARARQRKRDGRANAAAGASDERSARCVLCDVVCHSEKPRAACLTCRRFVQLLRRSQGALPL